MKHSHLLQFGLFALAITVLAHCKTPEPEPDRVVQREDTLSIVSLRSLNSNQIPSSVRITDAGHEGTFRLSEADFSSPDNTGLVLVTFNGHRYIREFSGPASVTWFGVSTSDTDIGPELEMAIKATDNLVIPDGQYTQLTEVHLRSNMTIQANAGKVLITLPQSYISFVNDPNPDIHLDHILIDGLSWNVTSRQNGRYGTIYIDGPSVTDFTVQNCTSTDVAAKDSTNWLTLKIQAGKTASGIVVRNNNVQAKRMACEIFNHDNYNSYAGKTITVSGNNFHDCHFGLSLSGPLSGLTVNNNYIKNCSLFGIEIAGAAQNVTITNNKFEGVFDKFLEGSNDGDGNGSIVGGMVITGNTTVGVCQGGVQLHNGGATQFSKNVFKMTGMLELLHSTAGGTFSENVIESAANKAVICDNTPNNTFTNNTISNKSSTENQATFMAYGSGATNTVLTNNKLIKGSGGKSYDAVLGASCRASMNYDEAGNPIP
ncbi:right-handed parallel beta-helix repeat-containing protein [Spirosoma agri]|uniref:Right-handed parallel beta-helix repeat-containing protein n=1 Tax=Spirosoma agri TaxID=1987381 RepID=A0A6M0IRK1_9BACT|nr:right-handed parallel beta-helix repeat-containing protein [Spirosoma agri]NEU69583.1 right-handed parallel beta-helix repeat-containing protein [Spirosoma agri]